MKATEFVAKYASKGLRAWEAQALDMIASGDLAQPPFLEVPVTIPGHTGAFFAAGDYLAIGERGDYMRMPLTPRSAQRVADLFSVLLPTSKMVDDIARAADVKLMPAPEVPNRYVSLEQFFEHSRKVDEAMRQKNALNPITGQATVPVAGSMKDVILRPRDKMPDGKVVIYGWHRPDGTHIQPRSSVHAEDYLDYSHGIRLIAPNMVVDGRNVLVTDVLKDPVLHALLSDEGPVTRPRYGKEPPPLPPEGEQLSYVQMLARLRALG